jgi:Domain of unknown function (DUF4139)/N-terminal domain of unknown function (DUF4140)
MEFLVEMHLTKKSLMKKLFIVLALAQAFVLSGQENPEKAIESEVEQVTVFFANAQITRKKSLSVEPGISSLKFQNLSPYINPKSVQVKVDGAVTVLSVNHQLNYLDDLEKPKELVDLESKYKAVEEKIKVEQAYLNVIDEEVLFLQENRKIGGKNQELSVSNLKEASEFYSTKLTALKLKRIERQNSIFALREELGKIGMQINNLSSTKKYPSGEILVRIDSKSKESIKVNLSYLVDNAGWFPSYDIRAKSVEDPLEIVYKANVHQDTKVDWKNVNLAFSSSNPSLSGTAPELLPYYLNYNSVPPTYKSNINEVSGRIMDSQGNPLPGANVVVTGTTIGTVADLNGNFSLAIPPRASSLKVSYIGFITQEIPIRNAVISVVLEEDLVSLDEVVVTGYGIEPEADISPMLAGSVAGVNISRSKSRPKAESSLAIPMVQVENQTSVEFSIDMPYSVKSDSKNHVVGLTTYEVPAYYEYYCVPKIDKDAFLLGYITNWEQYKLLEGEANIFFEDTYIGKSILDVRFISDTLSVSLGRDKSVSVNREKIKDLTSWKLIGSKKEETRAWKISVKNNKTQAINMVLLDQVPVPTIEELELDIKDLSGGKRNEDSGEIKWMLKLDPKESKEVDLKYSLKYPKYQNIILE